MTRIIAGTYGGRRLKVPKGDGTRPTSDRVREAMFSSIQSELGGFDDELRVLDLFAGSGALGLEALSRGAGWCQFVESDRRAAGVIKDNRAHLGVRSASIVTTRVEAYVADATEDHFGLVFLDPPYAMPTETVRGVVAALGRLTESGALIVVERSSRDPFEWPEGVEGLRDKAYGETRVWYGR